MQPSLSLDCTRLSYKDKEAELVSIIGSKASGKSYLINQILDTRFDVAPEGGTEGIWMSMVEVEGQNYAVLDCGGLVSDVRSTEAEIKMCLALAAVSDVLIFNTDVSGVHQDSQRFFESMNLACGRLKGEQLLKGSSWITLRNVRDSQYEDMVSVIQSEVEGEERGLFEMFSGHNSTFCIHNSNKTELQS